MSEHSTPENGATRRGFVKSTAAAAAASSVLFPAVSARAQDDKKLKIGVVGLGGRGTGATAQALTADDNCVLHAVGDIYAEKLDQQLEVVANTLKNNPEKIGVGDRKFVGLDAYQKVIDSGVDVILLATPPGFRPQHFEAAVEAGIHAFVEKPCATDIAGVKRFIAAGKKAKEKGLSVLAGFCYRYSHHGREMFNRIHDGAIGDIQTIHATYYTGGVKAMPKDSDRPAGMSDTEWQIKNWYNFTWLAGDGIVEQGIHSVDKVFWAMQDQAPKAVYCMGGRQKPNNSGNTYDHFHAIYEFENDVRAHVNWSQYWGKGLHRDNTDYIKGSEGIAKFDIKKASITGKSPWQFPAEEEGGRRRRGSSAPTPKSMYQIEHDEFFANIRKGERHADEEWMANSTLYGIMARMSAYTGKRITVETALNSGELLVPENVDWNGDLAIRPEAIPGQDPVYLPDLEDVAANA